MSHRSAVFRPAGSPPELNAVIESAGSGIARSITGNTQAAVAVESPARNAEEPRNVDRSRPRARPWKTPASPATATAARRIATERDASASKSGLFTRHVATVTTSQSTVMATKRRRAAARLLSRTGPSVFQARNADPCAASATSAKTPTRQVYQSRIPTGSRALKLVKSVSSNQPSAVSGTPRIRLPSAAPRNTGKRELASAKKKSQEKRQTGS